MSENPYTEASNDLKKQTIALMAYNLISLYEAKELLLCRQFTLLTLSEEWKIMTRAIMHIQERIDEMKNYLQLMLRIF